MSTASILNRNEKTSALLEVCSVRLAQTWFGVPITHILEIVGSARPQRNEFFSRHSAVRIVAHRTATGIDRGPQTRAQPAFLECCLLDGAGGLQHCNADARTFSEAGWRGSAH